MKLTRRYAMQIIFSDQPIPNTMTKSIFLAGPSPRNNTHYDWRKDAIGHLESVGFDGTVFLPYPKKVYEGDETGKWHYDNQVAWECAARKISDVIAFWVPRDIKGGMPAFTTNVEFGEDLNSGKIVYGRPDNAEKCRYLDKRAIEKNLHIYTTLEGVLNEAVKTVGVGSYRSGPEVNIPLFIWETEQFQGWYSSVKQNGNVLCDANVLHHFKVGNNLFSFTLWVDLFVTSENRHKNNEFVFSRKDISVIVPYYNDGNDTYTVLIKEFRSPVRNEKGIVYEIPGGSSFKPGINPLTNARDELFEETGIRITDENRFKYCGSRQLVATLSAHVAHLYGVELTKNEFNELYNHANQNTILGEHSDERITLEIVKTQNLFDMPLDYSNIGMIFEVIRK